MELPPSPEGPPPPPPPSRFTYPPLNIVPMMTYKKLVECFREDTEGLNFKDLMSCEKTTTTLDLIIDNEAWYRTLRKIHFFWSAKSSCLVAVEGNEAANFLRDANIYDKNADMSFCNALFSKVNALERNEAMRRAGRDYRTVIVDHTLTMRKFVVYVVTIGVAKYKQLSPPDAVRQLFESYLLPYSGDLLDPYLFRDLLIEMNEEDDEDPQSLRAMVYNHRKQLHKLFISSASTIADKAHGSTTPPTLMKSRCRFGCMICSTRLA
jgi:hypothetical protein